LGLGLGEVLLAERDDLEALIQDALQDLGLVLLGDRIRLDDAQRELARVLRHKSSSGAHRAPKAASFPRPPPASSDRRSPPRGSLAGERGPPPSRCVWLARERRASQSMLASVFPISAGVGATLMPAACSAAILSAAAP